MQYTITPRRKRPSFLWSEAATWAAGSVPVEGEVVTIPQGQTVVLDTTTADLSGLKIYGTLQADPTVDVGITSNYVEVWPTGELAIGTSAAAYTNNATITLNGPIEDFTPRYTTLGRGPWNNWEGTETFSGIDRGLDSPGVERALRVMPGGKLRLFGNPPAVEKTKLNAHAEVGANTFTLAEDPGWSAGDEIAIAPTDFYIEDVHSTEYLTLAFDSIASSVSTTQTLDRGRWGVLQYPTDTTVSGNAVSLVSSTFTPPYETTPRVLDERAEVINLTRNIVIQSVSDAIWEASGWGAHTMVMGVNSVAQLRGVQFLRGGQERRMGRYAFHWHMLSYNHYHSPEDPGGEYLGDVVDGDHFLEKCSMVRSANRAVTIHGTCGVKVMDTVAADIKGHAFFFEDGSEERNLMSGCVAMDVSNPLIPMKGHDREPAGYWYTNPQNKLIGNTAIECMEKGVWNAFSPSCFGLSRAASGDGNRGLIIPNELVIDTWEDNTAHSCRRHGIATDDVNIDEFGTTHSIVYNPGGAPFLLKRGFTWKNRAGGYLNRVGLSRYADWTAADNDGRDFAGQTEAAIMSGTLLICSSLNSDEPLLASAQIGVASYHHEIDFSGLTFMNYPYSDPVMEFNGQFFYGGGCMDNSDQYLHAVALGGYRNPGWKLINSHAGYITPPPYFDGQPITTPTNSGYRYWPLPVQWDPYGYWGASGDYLATNDPFFTHEMTASTVSPEQSSLVFTPDRFYGAFCFQVDSRGAWIHDGPLVNFESDPPIATRMARLDYSSYNEVGHHLLDAGSGVLFAHFKDFSLKKDGMYNLTFPASENPVVGPVMPTSSLTVAIMNAYRTEDRLLLGLPWPNNVSVSARLDSGEETLPSFETRLAGGYTRVIGVSGTSIDDVKNDTTGSTAYQDNTNNRVWVLVVGGLNYINESTVYSGVDQKSLEKTVQILLDAT